MDNQSAIGKFLLRVYSGKGRRKNSSAWELRCDAIACQGGELLLLSVVGPETTVNAVRGALFDHGKSDEFEANVGTFQSHRLYRSPAGYRCYKTRLAFKDDIRLWHMLVVSEKDGFLPVLTEDTLWGMLHSEKFTTPLVREWVPWLMNSMIANEMLVKLDQYGCNAAILTANDTTLDDLVTQGIKGGHLKIVGAEATKATRPSNFTGMNLDSYMLTYGHLLGKQAERSLQPLHVPGQHPLPKFDLLRSPLEGQAHVIAGTAKALKRQKSVIIAAQVGTGKTLMSAASVHTHANGRPYRSLIMAPGHLVEKWKRELEQTIPDAQVFMIESWKDLLHLRRGSKPTQSEWYIIGRDRVKLGAKWKPVYLRRKREGMIRCPSCCRHLVDKNRVPIDADNLHRNRAKCEFVLEKDEFLQGCGSPLWTMTGDIYRYEPARFIQRRLRGFFNYLVVDEIHECKGDTAQGNAAGTLASACKKTLELSGTLSGGYAWHVKNLLYRFAPQSLVAEGITWEGDQAFNERYGRIETTIRDKVSMGDDNRQSRGRSHSVTKSVRPGIMPMLYGRHLIDKTVFLSLEELAANLPPLDEELIAVDMDDEQSKEYERIEDELRQTIKQMLVRGDRRLLATLLQTLLVYPDFPFNWKSVGYLEKDQFIPVVKPKNLDPKVLRPKEAELLRLVKQEKEAGRKVWVYVQYTNTYDVQSRIENMLKAAGLKVGVLKSTVDLKKREAWIAKHSPGVDVMVCFPKLVETGLDFFDKPKSYNFPTIILYEEGYNLFLLRQSAGRSWRIGQDQPCKVFYLYYRNTMQDRAMTLMAKKLAAAQALEGKFSSEGLVSMAGEEGSMEMALAKSLVENMNEGDARRIWNRVGADGAVQPVVFNRLSGEELVKLMRKQRVTIKNLAAHLGVPESQVKATRKSGADDGQRWIDAITAIAPPKSKTRKALSTVAKAAVAAMFLLWAMASFPFTDGRS